MKKFFCFFFVILSFLFIPISVSAKESSTYEPLIIPGKYEYIDGEYIPATESPDQICNSAKKEGFLEGEAVGYESGYEKGYNDGLEDLNNSLKTSEAGAHIIWATIFTVLQIFWYFGKCVPIKNALKERESNLKEIEAGLLAAKKYVNEQEIKIRADNAIIKDKMNQFFNYWNETFKRTLSENKQGHPELANQISDIEDLFDSDVVNFLRTKPRPAIKQAEEISRIKNEKKTLKAQCKMLEYQLSFLDSLFPWLEEFREVSIQDAISSVKETVGTNYDPTNSWLSPDEFKKLESAKRNQLAFERWQRRKKSDWEVGIEYERYIGYLYEQKGYKVKYNGAITKKEDMGRDLIVTNDKETLVIQCKRLSLLKNHLIHENVVCQLFGTTTVLSIQHPNRIFKGILVTTSELTDIAKSFADTTGITVQFEQMKPYPMIKCNISDSGEKIYHLPIDQQYDKVQIGGKKGCFFTWTCEEAEKKGFRRAYKWNPERNNS